VLLVPSDNPPLSALDNVAADKLGRVGMNVDAQSMDYGTMLARRLRKEPVECGGWSAFVNGSGGLDWLNPGWNAVIRGNGDAGYPGWSISRYLGLPTPGAPDASVPVNPGYSRRAVSPGTPVTLSKIMPDNKRLEHNHRGVKGRCGPMRGFEFPRSPGKFVAPATSCVTCSVSAPEPISKFPPLPSAHFLHRIVTVSSVLQAT
jgi:hypothetical protein